MLFTKIFKETYTKNIYYNEIVSASKELPQIETFYNIRTFNLKKSVRHLKNLATYFTTPKHKKFFFDIMRALLPNEEIFIDDHKIRPPELKKLLE